MALYGQSFYGVDTYGAQHGVDFSVDPFIAVPNGYNSIRLTWSSPTGSWDRIRLIQSRTGYASNESDGLILIDSDHAVAEYKDVDLLDNAWYYYSIFILADGDWNLVGTASALSVASHGMAELLWEKTPRWFRYEPVNPDATIKVWEPTAEIIDIDSGWQENQTLKGFTGVLGWGLDHLRAYAETLLWANDTRQTHLANVFRLSQTLGEEWEPRVPAYLMRQKVQNAGVLAQKRGTLSGLRDLVATSVGYDIDLGIGPNMFLSEDQAGFANPQYAEWDPGVNYAVNDLVTYLGKVWKAKVGTMGQAQHPPQDASTSNTWWNLISGTTTPAMVSDVLRDPTTGAIVTWKSFVGNTNKPLSVAYGVSDPYDQLHNASNALWVRNTDAVTQSYTVVGAANPLTADSPTPSSDAAVLQGIPLPRLLNWDAEVEYETGDYVVYQGVSYQALRVSIGRRPDSFQNDWKKIGYDDRLPFSFSFWTHAGFTGVDNTSASILCTGNVQMFDGQGKALPMPSSTAIPLIDSFNSGLFKPLGTRNVEVGNGVFPWVAQGTGSWVVVPNGDGSSVAWAQTGAVNSGLAGEKAVNGGFENGFTGWIQGPNFSHGSIDATTAHSGTSSLNVAAGPGSGTVVQQNFPVQPGMTITPSIWVKTTADYNGTSANGKLRLGKQDGSILQAVTFPVSSSGWTKITSAYTVPLDGSVTQVQVSIVTDHTVGTLWLDDFSSVIAPIPTLATVDGTALGLTAYRVSATFGKAPLAGDQALLASCSATNPSTFHTAVTRTRLYENISGTIGVTANLSSPILDGDHVILDINSTTKVAKVFVNAETAPRAQITFTRDDTHIYGLMIV